MSRSSSIPTPRNPPALPTSYSPKNKVFSSNVHALTFVVQEYNYECLMAAPRIRAESKAAVAACGAPAAGAFLNSLPRKPELKLDETS